MANARKANPVEINECRGWIRGYTKKPEPNGHLILEKLRDPELTLQQRKKLAKTFVESADGKTIITKAMIELLKRTEGPRGKK